MGEDAGPSGSTVGQTQDPEQIREQIEATREELGDTVEALAAKTDVKAQAKRKVEETKARLADKQEDILGKAKDASPDDAVEKICGFLENGPALARARERLQARTAMFSTERFADEFRRICLEFVASPSQPA